MECPKCQQRMDIRREDTSHSKQGMEYERTTYQCSQDDTWITVEVPRSAESRESILVAGQPS
jgi:hypothetical protein